MARGFRILLGMPRGRQRSSPSEPITAIKEDVLSPEVNKQHILDEIKRTAKDNGGVPLGKDRFFQETGIKGSDWFGKFWSRWGDAVIEAGFSPNKLQAAYPEDELILKFIGLIRELRRVPVTGELRLKRLNDPSFPNDKVFFSRFGAKNQIVGKNY